MGISDRVAVLDHGAQDRGREAPEIEPDAAVVEAYLGPEE